MDIKEMIKAFQDLSAAYYEKARTNRNWGNDYLAKWYEQTAADVSREARILAGMEY